MGKMGQVNSGKKVTQPVEEKPVPSVGEEDFVVEKILEKRWELCLKIVQLLVDW